MNSSVIMDLASLTSEAGFQRFSALQAQPNFFRAVGRTHTETWHSAFLGWLLDPEGSHQLRSFPLRRFLAVVARSQLTPTEPLPPGFLSPSDLATTVATRSFEEAAVLPNEREQQELVLPSGRADVWVDIPDGIDYVHQGNCTALPIKIIVEVKVDAGLGELQCMRYADDLAKLTGSDGTSAHAVAVFVARAQAMKESSASTTGDDRWYCIDFQTLHDDVIVPCVEHPEISPRMRGLIEHYLLNLRDPKGRRGRMAYTDEERKLARQIYSHHRATFSALAEILQDEDGFPQNLVDHQGTEGSESKLALKLQVSGESVLGSNVPDLFAKTVFFIWGHGKSIPQVPYVCGPKRFLIASSPFHQDGSPFLSPKQISNSNGETVFIETKFSRAAAIRLAGKILGEAGFQLDAVAK